MTYRTVLNPENIYISKWLFRIVVHLSYQSRRLNIDFPSREWLMQDITGYSKIKKKVVRREAPTLLQHAISLACYLFISNVICKSTGHSAEWGLFWTAVISARICKHILLIRLQESNLPLQFVTHNPGVVALAKRYIVPPTGATRACVIFACVPTFRSEMSTRMMCG
jgi:hypothetical protein